MTEDEYFEAVVIATVCITLLCFIISIPLGFIAGVVGFIVIAVTASLGDNNETVQDDISAYNRDI